MSAMKKYQPNYILLCGNTPLDQCLCDTCENTEQLLRVLQSLGMHGIPSNRYDAIDKCGMRRELINLVPISPFPC